MKSPLYNEMRYIEIEDEVRSEMDSMMILGPSYGRDSILQTISDFNNNIHVDSKITSLKYEIQRMTESMNSMRDDIQSLKIDNNKLNDMIIFLTRQVNNEKSCVSRLSTDDDDCLDSSAFLDEVMIDKNLERINCAIKMDRVTQRRRKQSLEILVNVPKASANLCLQSTLNDGNTSASYNQDEQDKQCDIIMFYQFFLLVGMHIYQQRQKRLQKQLREVKIRQHQQYREEKQIANAVHESIISARKFEEEKGNDTNTNKNQYGVWPVFSNGFPMKMMEKMGWSNGKGLGKAENGITKPINVPINVPPSKDPNQVKWPKTQS